MDESVAQKRTDPEGFFPRASYTSNDCVYVGLDLRCLQQTRLRGQCARSMLISKQTEQQHVCVLFPNTNELHAAAAVSIPQLWAFFVPLLLFAMARPAAKISSPPVDARPRDLKTHHVGVLNLPSISAVTRRTRTR